MDERTRQILHSSVEPAYRTPPALFEALDREFAFDLDAAADDDSALIAAWLGPGSPFGIENALGDDSWAAIAGTIADRPLTAFLNPPYSRVLANAYRTGRVTIDGVRHEDPASVDLEKARTYEIDAWAERCSREARAGLTIAGLFPFAPQTQWIRRWVYGHGAAEGLTSPASQGAPFFAASEVRIIPHRVQFHLPDGRLAPNVAAVNSCVVIWRPDPGYVGPWVPAVRYWDYR